MLLSTLFWISSFFVTGHFHNWQAGKLEFKAQCDQRFFLEKNAVK